MSNTDHLRIILQHSHPNPKFLSMTDKVTIINKIFELTACDPEQGSKEWAENRQIGGSDAGAMLGKGYFGKGPFEVIKDKILPGAFNGNLATRFGRTFEEVSRLIIEKIFGHQVWEFKSLPNQLPYTSYSPDGVTIAYILQKMLMILLEFKTPLSRIPDGKIPKEYLPQIKSGMCAMPFVDGALFVNSMLRICSLKDFAYNFEYNTRVHKQDTTTTKVRKVCVKDQLSEVIGMGMVVLYQNDIQKSNVKEHFDNDDSEFGNFKTTSSYGRSFVVFDTGPSFEDDLLKTPILSGDKAVQAIYERHHNRNLLYSAISKIHPTLDIPEFDCKVEEIKDLNSLFKFALLSQNEKEFGMETEGDTDSMFQYIDEKKFIGIKHITPFLIYDQLAKIPLLKSCGFASNGNIEVNSKSADYITQDARIYFIEQLNSARQSCEKSGIHIVGVIPYKIFKMDLIYTSNDEPKFMENLRPGVEIYGKIREECKEINLDNSLGIDEVNKAKWNVLVKYFPDKKAAQETQEQQIVNDGLMALMNGDDSMF